MLPRTLLFIWIGIRIHDVRVFLGAEGGSGVDRASVVMLVLATVVGMFFYFKRYLSTP